MNNPIPKIFRKFNISFQDGGWAGICSEVKLPALEQIFEKFRGGGQDMGTPISIGMETPEIEFTMEEHVASVQAKFGRHDVEGRFAAAKSDGRSGAEKYTISFTGLFQGLDLGSTQAGEGKSPMKGKIVCSKLTVTNSGKRVLHVDGPGGILEVDGVDLLQDLRNAAEV